MTDEDVMRDDAVILASSVRQIAVKASRFLKGSVDNRDVCELFEELEALERMIDGEASSMVGGWLNSLRQQLEEQALASV